MSDQWVPIWEAALPKAPSTARDADTLERILDAAGRVFARDGVADVHMTRLAVEADVSKPTLYRYVSGKRSLIELYFARESRRLFNAVIDEHWRDDLDEEALATILVELLLGVRRHPVIVRLVEYEWDGLALFFARSLANDTFAALLDMGTWLFERAGIENPRRAAEVNLRIMATFALAPPVSVPDTADGIRRCLFLPGRV